MTRDHRVAAEWLTRFEGAGLDGVIAKPASGQYEPGKRAMIKVKHARTADCVVAGFRWHKAGKDLLVGSLLLGLYDDRGCCNTWASPRRSRWRCGSSWRWSWRRSARAPSTRIPGVSGTPRTAASAPACPGLRAGGVRERISPGSRCESSGCARSEYDHMQGPRFRHAAFFLRWRSDKRPRDCRYDQLEVTPAYELENVFGAGAGAPRAAPSPSCSTAVAGDAIAHPREDRRRGLRRNPEQLRPGCLPGSLPFRHYSRRWR